MKIFDAIKFGFGFYFGYEIAKRANEIGGVLYSAVKSRIEKGC